MKYPNTFPQPQKQHHSLLISCLLLLSPFLSLAQSAFLTTWSVEANETITIPANGPYTYNYDIDWDYDGITFTADVTGATGKATSPAYTTAGNYQVAIRGAFPAIYFDYGVDRQKISSIDQWGDIAWESMNRAFSGCTNLGYAATDAPNLTGVTDVSFMFSGASSFNGDLSSWNTSSVTNMASMFSGASSFNGDLSGWETGSVTSMASMFHGASSFNRDLNTWNTAAVANMSLLFYKASSFNGDLSSWNTGTVYYMDGMFYKASAFNGDLSTWNTAAVTNMSYMFREASSFNGDLSGWNTASVINMYTMFHGASSFNSDLSAWNTLLVRDMGAMFFWATSFNSDLSGWNTSSVRNMEYMFFAATSFNGNLSGWNTSLVTNMESMFEGASSFNGDLSGWNTFRVTNMESMFAYATSFNGDLSAWKTGSVEDMSYMFAYASSFNGDLSGWKTASVTNMYAQFAFATAFTGDLSNWNTALVINMGYMFGFAKGFNADLSAWNTAAVINMGNMFELASSFDGDLSTWDVSNVKFMDGMLDSCGMSTANYDKALIGWAGQSLQFGVNLGAAGLSYCSGVTARTSLIGDDGWDVSGDTNACGPAGISISLKAMLAGPYSNLLMDDLLRADALLPTTEPYTGLGFVPVNSTGGESIGDAVSVFGVTGNNAIVDWIHVQLRDPTNSTIVLATVNGLLQRDGDIVDTGGILPLFVPDMPYGDYFISIHHRNHLPVMTETAHTLTEVGGTLDFSAAATAIYGSNGRKEVSGKFLLWSGDATVDGFVDASDRSATWNSRNQSGYLIEDVNLDGFCDASDRSVTWNHRNKAAQLP